MRRLSLSFLCLLAIASCLDPVKGSATHRRPVVRPRRSPGWVSGERALGLAGGSLRERHFEQHLDHFHFKEDRTFQQRYFICSKHFKDNGPVFFYAGNEGDVSLYVNNTGLMWEHAEAFGALLIFAEHRYYGQTQPFGRDSWRVDPSYLTTEQAMADFAHLVYGVKSELGIHDSPVIVFGGSYGGMLAAWLRMKYPTLFQGAVAASAPIGAFPGSHTFQPSKFWQIVTTDATPAAGAPEHCPERVRSAFAAVLGKGDDAPSLKDLQKLLRLCDPVDNDDQRLEVAYMLQGAFDAFAMGNYPYPSSYINGDPDHPLPAWPMRAACYVMEASGDAPKALVEALGRAAGLLYNASGTVPCLTRQASGPAAGNSGPWDYQFCTELMGQEQPYYPATGAADMFWDQGPYDMNAINQHCQAAWNVTPRVLHSFVGFGGVEAAEEASNIVFSNGDLDPWSAFSVTEGSIINPSVVVLTIPNGAHHVDLMFSNPADTPDIVAARLVEMNSVRAWIEEHSGKVAARKAREQAAAERGEL